jgi:hypothetical protein
VWRLQIIKGLGLPWTPRCNKSKELKHDTQSKDPKMEAQQQDIFWVLIYFDNSFLTLDKFWVIGNPIFLAFHASTPPSPSCPSGLLCGPKINSPSSSIIRYESIFKIMQKHKLTFKFNYLARTLVHDLPCHDEKCCVYPKE